MCVRVYVSACAGLFVCVARVCGSMYMPMGEKTQTSEEVVEEVIKRGAKRKLVRTMTAVGAK